MTGASPALALASGSTLSTFMNDSRHPYTYACDYIRVFGGYGSGGVKLSRSDASQIRQAVAVAIGMDDALLAEKLADYYKANEQALSEQNAKRLLAELSNTKAQPRSAERTTNL